MTTMGIGLELLLNEQRQSRKPFLMSVWPLDSRTRKLQSIASGAYRIAGHRNLDGALLRALGRYEHNPDALVHDLDEPAAIACFHQSNPRAPSGEARQTSPASAARCRTNQWRKPGPGPSAKLIAHQQGRLAPLPLLGLGHALPAPGDCRMLAIERLASGAMRLGAPSLEPLLRLPVGALCIVGVRGGHVLG
jgi:hypothetical protein